MAKRNPEIRLLMKILAVAGFIVLLILLAGYLFVRFRAPHLLEFGKKVQEIRIQTELDSLNNTRFIEGMNGCENLWLDTAGTGLYVTTLDGYIHYLDSDSNGVLVIKKSFQAGATVTGICAVNDSMMAAMVNFSTPEEWIEKGAAVCLLDEALDTIQPITGDYPAANGICRDSDGNLYFASCNFNFLDPSGNVYFMKQSAPGAYNRPVPLFDLEGLTNGMYWDGWQQRVYFSTTIGGVYSFMPGQEMFRLEYQKTRFMEACDDLCTDRAGNLWMTDPGYSTIKIYNPGTNRLVRFIISGMGQASSCRIRMEDGMEIVYITELKRDQRPFSRDFNGRGVARIPVKELLKLIPPSKKPS